jgi:hypothetical protein
VIGWDGASESPCDVRMLIDADIAVAFTDVRRAFAEAARDPRLASRAVIGQSARRLVPRRRAARMHGHATVDQAHRLGASTPR